MADKEHLIPKTTRQPSYPDVYSSPVLGSQYFYCATTSEATPTSHVTWVYNPFLHCQTYNPYHRIPSTVRTTNRDQKFDLEQVPDESDHWDWGSEEHGGKRSKETLYNDDLAYKQIATQRKCETGTLQGSVFQNQRIDRQPREQAQGNREQSIKDTIIEFPDFNSIPFPEGKRSKRKENMDLAFGYQVVNNQHTSHAQCGKASNVRPPAHQAAEKPTTDLTEPGNDRKNLHDFEETVSACYEKMNLDILQRDPQNTGEPADRYNLPCSVRVPHVYWPYNSGHLPEELQPTPYKLNDHLLQRPLPVGPISADASSILYVSSERLQMLRDELMAARHQLEEYQQKYKLVVEEQWQYKKLVGDLSQQITEIENENEVLKIQVQTMKEDFNLEKEAKESTESYYKSRLQEEKEKRKLLEQGLTCTHHISSATNHNPSVYHIKGRCGGGASCHDTANGSTCCIRTPTGNVTVTPTGVTVCGCKYCHEHGDVANSKRNVNIIINHHGGIPEIDQNHFMAQSVSNLQRASSFEFPSDVVTDVKEAD